MTVGVIVGVSVIIVVTIAILVVLLAMYARRRKIKNVSSVSDKRHKYSLTKADIVWNIPQREDSINEVQGVYTLDPMESIMKEDADYANIKDIHSPSIDSQALGKNEEDVFQDDLSTFPQTVLQRRLTNRTEPKLARLKKPKSLGLNQNPIYESTAIASGGVSNNNSQPPLSESALADLYAKPIKKKSVSKRNPPPDEKDSSKLYAVPMKKKNRSLNWSSESIYSESLTPAMFCQAAPESDYSLQPYGPIYAEPSLVAHGIKEVSSSNFRELKHLGVGQFGEVVLAETVGVNINELNLPNPISNSNSDASIKVAIKKLRSDAEPSIHENFDKEIKFMSGLKHENIICLLAVGRGLHPFIMIEYMDRGDLNQLLNDYEGIAVNQREVQRAGGKIHVSSLVYASMQLACGMKYLASHNCVHRDLATRNCLVDKNFIVKVGDFGMSRSLYDRSYYKVEGRAVLPIRWMATECFYGRFSEKTDAWSFGVTLWEIFTLCKSQPYGDADDQDIINDAIKEEGRLLLEKPKDCPEDVHKVMLRCWEYDSEDRGTFAELYEKLSCIHELHRQSTGWV